MKITKLSLIEEVLGSGPKKIETQLKLKSPLTL